MPLKLGAKAWRGVIESMLEKMLQSTFLAPIFTELQREFEAAANKRGSLVNIAENIANVFDSGEIEDAISIYTDGLQAFQDQFKDFGLNLWEETADEAKGLSRGIQSVTEDTANIIAAYMNTIRNEVILHTGYLNQIISISQTTQSIATSQLNELIAIRNNTAGMLEILEDVTNGVKTLRVV